MSKSTKLIILFLLFGLLGLIRLFESQLFYDPYLVFFQNDYLYLDNPRREVFKVTLFTVWRYVLNAILSLVILFVMFRDKGIVKLSAFIYAIALCALLSLYLYFVINPRQEDYYIFFNIRRFLIQPILLLLLLPAFYYHRLKR